MTDTERLNKNKRISETKRNTIERHSKMRCMSFEVKIQSNKLSASQKEALKMVFVEQKWLKNEILGWSELSEENKISKFDTKKKTVTHLDKDKNPVESEFKYLSAQSKQCLVSRMISNIKALHSLKVKGIQKCGKLKFSSEETCIDLKQYGTSYQIKSSSKIKIAGIPKYLKVNGLEQFLGIEGIEIANARLLKRIDGYYVQITCFLPKEEKQSNGKVIGIDFGCETSFTTSEKEKIDIKIEETERLKRLSKRNNHRLIQLFNEKYGYNPDFQNKEDCRRFSLLPRSNNFNKTNDLIKKEYQKIMNQKNDIANKFVHKLKNYEKVIIQDEQLANWQKGNHGKAVQHSILGRVKAKLKTLDNVYVLDKFEPTTILCRNCGRIHREMTQYDRVFKCECGVEEDRDIHAAENMIFLYEYNISHLG